LLGVINFSEVNPHPRGLTNLDFIPERLHHGGTEDTENGIFNRKAAKATKSDLLNDGNEGFGV